MGVGGGLNCLRMLLFAFNFIFWLLGVAVLSIGIWSRVDGSWMSAIADSVIENAANMMIASGIIVAIIGFLGCCGAVRRSQCMLVSYAVMILLIFVLELSAGVYAYSQREKAQQDLEDNVKSRIKESYGTNESSFHHPVEGLEIPIDMSLAIDLLQEHSQNSNLLYMVASSEPPLASVLKNQSLVKCCGATAASDWLDSDWYLQQLGSGAEVPESCCVHVQLGCSTGRDIDTLLRENIIHSTGCVKTGKEFIKQHLWKIGGTGIGVGVIQLLGIIIAFCFCSAIRQHDKGAMG